MAQQIINLGTSPNDGEGDNLRGAFDKVNDNFTEVYTAGPVGSNITISGATISTTATNANLTLSPNGTGKIIVKNDTLPDQTNIRYLGSANLRYRGAFIGTAGINSTGDIITTGNITANNIRYTSSVFVGDLQGSVFGDDSTVIIDGINNVVSADSGVFTNLTTGNILPSANVTYNLGSPTAQWKELYVSGNTIYLNGTALSVSGNTLSVAGSNVAIDGSVNYTVTSADVEAHQANLTITESQISDLQNYLTSYTVTSADVTAHQANLTITESQISDLSHASTGNFTLTNNTIQTSSGDTGIDLVISGATSGDPPAFVNKAWRFVNDGSLQFRSPINIGAEVDATITATKIGQWDTAYGWGDHSTQGYLTSVSGFITDNADDTMSGKLTISNSGTIGATTPDNGYLKITDGSSTLALDPNEIYSTTNLQITTSTGTGITGNLTVTGNVSGDNFVGNVTGNLTGTASSATTASLASAISIVSTTGTAQEFPVLFASGSGNHTPRVDATKLTFNPSSDTLSVNSATVTSTKIGQWDTAYGWGNHASAGYVESDTTGITGADQVTNMVSLTQAEYNAITPNASTVYFIVG